MTSRRIIAALWGAVILIALQFAPSAASAHAGHDHGARAVHASAVGHSPASLDQPAQAETSVHAVQTIVEVSATASLAGHASRSMTCSGASCGGSCGGGCSACCGSFIPPQSAECVAPAAGQAALIVLLGSAALGLDPEILPKPPKSLA
jgi:hypothetical protein